MKPIVGEGLAPPGTFRINVIHREANTDFRRVRRLRRTETFPFRLLYHAEQIPVFVGMVNDHPHGRNVSVLSNVFDTGNALQREEQAPPLQ